MKAYKDFTVMVVGAGTMGLSMAQVMAANGIKTYMTSRHPSTLTEAAEKMERAYARYGDNWVDTLFRQTVDIP